MPSAVGGFGAIAANSNRIETFFIGRAAPGGHRAGAGGWPCQGIYHRPVDRRVEVALIATHYNIDFSQHYLAEYMAARGYGFLGWNTRFRGAESHFLVDHAVADIGAGVRFLREEAGVRYVVLLGNSGGGSLMAAYQSQAVEPNLRPLSGMSLAEGIDNLLPGDGYISLAAHPGRPEVLTAWLDAAVVDENDPTQTDESLYLWNPDHGPPYTPDFVGRYRAAQVARNRQITDWANDELRRLSRAGYTDRLFTVARTWADPRMVDPALDASNRRPNQCYQGDPQRANSSVWGLAGATTLRTWLSMWSLETSQCRGAPHLARCEVPSLVVNADRDTGVFPSDAQMIFDSLGASDKSILTIDGDHYFLEPDGARDVVADTLATWITHRFS